MSRVTRGAAHKSVPDAKQDALDALDALLGSGYPGSAEKLAALRDVSAAAQRMAKNVAEWDGQRERAV